jgi:HEAT repeat protein
MNECDNQEDTRSTTELVNALLSSNDEDAVDSGYWNALSDLHRRGTLDIFEAARVLCTSTCPFEQRAGCRILAQLGAPQMPFVSESFPLIESVMRGTNDMNTLANAVSALGWLHDLRGVDLLLPHVDHANQDIRYWVTLSLTALREDKRCVDALIRLSADPSAEVRDWATFGLGSMTEQDNVAIREALLARLDDDDAIVRGEALVGLAKRQDERVVEPLLKELDAGTYNDAVNDYAQEALNALKNVGTNPRLIRWKTND